jgi:hypothetical protein
MKTATKHTLKIILFSFSILAVAGVSVLFYQFHKQVQTPQVRALDAIPINAALFFESFKPADFLDSNSEAKPMYKLFLNEKQQENLQKMFSLLKETQHGFDIGKRSKAVYLSVHSSRKDMALLIGIEVDRHCNKDLKNYVQRLANFYHKESFSYKNNQICKLHIDNDILYLNHQNGLLLFSFDESLLRAGIDRISLKDSVLHNVVYGFAHKSDANVSLRLYLQYAQCEPIFKKMLETTDGDAQILGILRPFSWAALEVKRKNEKMLFSGYAMADTTAVLAKLFTHKDKMLDIGKLLPYNAQDVFYVNAGSYQRFSKIRPYVRTSEDIFALMYPNQLITFTLNHGDSLSHALLLVSEEASEAAFHLLNSVGSNFAENNYHLDTFYINTAMVGAVNLNNFLITRLGYNQDFPKLRYYTIFDNCVVFTDTKAGMIAYIQALQAGQTLKINQKYQDLSSYFSNQANLLYYNISPAKEVQSIGFQYNYFSGNLFLLDEVVEVKTMIND